MEKKNQSNGKTSAICQAGGGGGGQGAYCYIL